MCHLDAVEGEVACRRDVCVYVLDAGVYGYGNHKRRLDKVRIHCYVGGAGQRRNSVAELSEDDRQTVHEEWQI